MAMNNTNLLSDSSGGQKSKIGLARLKFRCQESCAPPGGSRGESIPDLFQLLEAAHIPWFMAPSSNCITLTSAFSVTSLTLNLLPPL